MKYSRVIYFDILNVIACIAVIALHHNGIVHNYNVNSSAWKEALFFEVAFYWAVPVFFMLTGATLISYREKYSTKDFFIKRVLRSVFPFLIWSMILLIHSYYLGNFPYKSMQEILTAILSTRIQHGDVYWFFIPYIAICCFIPVLSLLRDNKAILWYISIFIFITHSCFPLLFQFLGIKYNSSLSFPINGYILFVVLGYLFSTISLSTFQRRMIYFLGLGGALFRYFLTLHYSLEIGKVDKFLFGYIQFHSVLLALAVFVFIKSICENGKWKMENGKWISTLSSCSLGIYLIHKLVMSYELKLLNFKWDDGLWRTIGIILTYISCFIMVYFVKKLPYLRKIFP